MAGWKCARCSTVNDKSGISCSNCRLMRGSVVIARAPDGPIGTESIPVARPTPDAAPTTPVPWPPDAPPAQAPWSPAAPPTADSTSPAWAPTWVAPSPELAAPDLPPYWLYPTDDSWRQGDRTVQCAVFDPNQPLLTTSLKGANR